MIIPEGLLVGVPVAQDTAPSKNQLVEIGADFCDLPTKDQIRALAGPSGITLIGWHVLTHRRTDQRYRTMTDPPPEHAAVGHFDRSRWTDEAWEKTDALARAVDAQAVVFQTPPSFKASTEHATRLENFVANAMRPGLALAWEWAPGSWPAAKALALCDRIGAVPVLDPIETSVPDGEFIYLRFRGGATGRKTYKDDDLKKVALLVRDRIGWIVFSNNAGTQDAQRFAQMI